MQPPELKAIVTVCASDDRGRHRLDSLAEEILAIDRAKRDYPVGLSDALGDHRNKVQTDIERAAPAG